MANEVNEARPDNKLGLPKYSWPDLTPNTAVLIVLKYQNNENQQVAFPGTFPITSRVADVWYFLGLITTARMSASGIRAMKLYNDRSGNVIADCLLAIHVAYSGAGEPGEYIGPLPGRPRIINDELFKKHDSKRPIVITILLRDPADVNAETKAKQGKWCV